MKYLSFLVSFTWFSVESTRFCVTTSISSWIIVMESSFEIRRLERQWWFTGIFLNFYTFNSRPVLTRADIISYRLLGGSNLVPMISYRYEIVGTRRNQCEIGVDRHKQIQHEIWGWVASGMSSHTDQERC